MVGGTYEDRWRCSACILEHLRHVVDETSPVFAALMSLLVVRIVRLDVSGGSWSSVDVNDTDSQVHHQASHYVVDV